MTISNKSKLQNANVFIIGSNGQLGRAFQKELSARNIRFHAPDKKDCNITQFDEMDRELDSYSPEIVINCAAYNAVDDAESNENLADLINHKAVRNLAEICRRHNILFVHYGTSYVFDGNKEGLYIESDIPNPLNLYGKSKLAGEMSVLESGCKSLVLRPSWVYGNGIQNFIYKLLGWASKNKILKISSDEVSNPTSSEEIAKATIMLIEKDVTGLFHLTNSDYCSRYELSRFVLEFLNINNIVIPVPMSDFKTKAKRPSFLAMSNELISRTIGYDIPHWKVSLRKYLLKINGVKDLDFSTKL